MHFRDQLAFFGVCDDESHRVRPCGQAAGIPGAEGVVGDGIDALADQRPLGRVGVRLELEAVGRVVEVRQLHEVELLTLDGVVGDRVCASRTG